METITALGDSDKYDRSIEFRIDWGNQSRSYGVGGLVGWITTLLFQKY